MLLLLERNPTFTDFINKGTVLAPHMATVQKNRCIDSRKGWTFSPSLSTEKSPQPLDGSGAHGQDQLAQMETACFFSHQAPDLICESRSDAMAHKPLHRLGYFTATGIGCHRHLRLKGKDLHPGNREFHGQDKMMHRAGIVPFIEGMDQVGKEPFIQQIPFHDQTVFIRFITANLDRSCMDQLFFQCASSSFGRFYTTQTCIGQASDQEIVFFRNILIASCKKDRMPTNAIEYRLSEDHDREKRFTLNTRSIDFNYLKLFVFFTMIFLGCILPGTAKASFTLEDEKKLGKEFYEKLQKGNFLLQSEPANNYITLLGKRILSHSDQALFDFQFSIIKSSAIIAFATPGGYVYLNQGLINLAENEAELAGVLAHEIAHVNGRHIAEIIDKSTKLNISTLAAVLAGAFLGGGGDLTAAVASFSMAAAATLSLKYSRQQEEAADRTGLSYLVAAGYDGRAMLDFLKIMRRFEYYSNTIPSYFLTHPGTDERSHYIDALLQTTYNQGGADHIVGNLKRVQITLLLDTKVPDSNLPYFQKELNDHPEDPDLLYGLAKTEDRLGMTRESLEHFRKALRLAPDDPDILRDLGIALFKLGQFEDAAQNLRRAIRFREYDLEANLLLGKTLAALGDMQGALRLYKNLEARLPDDPEIHYNLAMVYGKMGQAGDSHYYFGLYFKKKGKLDSALFHLKAALKDIPPDHRARDIKKQIDSIKH
jgi:beta-barrel assembly-enhancing protease